MQGTNEGKSPCGLSVTATDVYVCVRNVSACMCMAGRKEGNKPCRLPNTNTYFCGYVRDTEFSAYVEGKKEGDNFFRLSITTTDSWLPDSSLALFFFLILELFVCVRISESLFIL